jgi:hypothetical protein
VITKNIPPGALGVARARQENISGYSERRKEQDALPPEDANSAPREEVRGTVSPDESRQEPDVDSDRR